MHPDIFTPEQAQLLPLIQTFSKNFYLVGGTALALQYGHRRSIDFDLFTNTSFENAKIKKQIDKVSGVDTVRLESQGELTLVVGVTKLTFLLIEEKIPHEVWLDDVISMPDDLTIAGMKAYVMGLRNKWKDYVDLYFLFQKYTLERVVKKAEELYGSNLFNERLFREQLAYHADIDYSEEVEWMPGFETQKEKILSSLLDISLS